MPGRLLYVWLTAVLVLWGSPGQAAPAAAKSPVALCTQHLLALGRALAAYQRDHHALPPNLSDLYPRYVHDVNLFHCPADPTPGEPGYVGAKPDPNMPISYFYEMSLEKDPAGVLLGPQPAGSFPTWRALKTAQRRYFGDRVPVIRCWHHVPQLDNPAQYASTPSVLNLTLSGQVYRSIPGWERDPGTVPTVLQLMQRDLKPGLRSFRRVWMPSLTAQYITELQGVTPDTSLRLRAAGDTLAAAGRNNPALAGCDIWTLIGALYHTAGYTAKATAALEQAVRSPGDHRIAAPLLAKIYHSASKDAEAIRFLQALLAREPNDVLSMELLSHAYEDDEQPEKADEWREKVDHWLVGQPAPDFTLMDAHGKPFRLSEQRGKVVVLLFWSQSDPASGWEAAFLEELNQKYRSRGVAICALSEEVTHADAKAVARLAFTFPLLLDAGPVCRQYGVLEVPTAYVIDRAGQVTLRRVGFDADTPGDLAAAIQKLMPVDSASRRESGDSGLRLASSP